MNGFEMLMRGICPKCNGSVRFSHDVGKHLCTQCGAYWSYDLGATDGDKMQVVVLEWKKINHNPNPHWKPSDEQMEVLTWCEPLFYDPKSKGILESLIDDLKKLK